MSTIAEVVDKITKHVHGTYLKSLDPEATDVVTFHEYFGHNFPQGGLARDNFKAYMEGLVVFLTDNGHQLPALDTVVPATPAAHQAHRFIVGPWSLGLGLEQTIKGASPMVHILETVHNFLAEPYLSAKEPLDVVFPSSQHAGSPILDWSIIHVIGMGKSAAARIILEAAMQLRAAGKFPDNEVLLIGPQLAALLRMHAVYDPAGSPEELLLKALGTKSRQADRPRPNPLMIAGSWSKIIDAQGLVFATVIDSRITDYNRNKGSTVGISSEERSFIKLFRHQNAAFIKLLEYHWTNFRVGESAVPLKVWGNPDLSPETKPSRAPPGNEHWKNILKWTPEANYYWLMRCVNTFTSELKKWSLSGKPVNLSRMANKLRCNFKDPNLHDQACTFSFFLGSWSSVLTQPQVEALVARYSKGYLNKDLDAAVKVKDAKLDAASFPFIATMTGTVTTNRQQHHPRRSSNRCRKTPS